MFHQLWKAGDTAHLNLDTHAGQAWIGLRTPLGYSGQPPQYSPQTLTHRQHSHPFPNHRSPSYYQRKECRKAAKAAEDTITNHEETQAEKADHVTVHNETPSDKIENHQYNPEPEKLKTNPPNEAAKPPTNDNPSTNAEKHLNNLTSETINPILTTEEVESMIESNIEEQTNLIMDDKTAKPTNEETITEEPTNPTKHQLQCEICTFKCNYMKSLKIHMKLDHINVVNKHIKTNDTDTNDNTDST